ncbi:MAG: TIGR04282 family arsenosugar biosynthesis glycosyltransferase [Acetobacteraceae bacterium]
MVSVKDTVIVFARAPRLGTVKTRLARVIGQRAALQFHRQTLLALLRDCRRQRRFRTILAVAPDRARFRLPVAVPRIDQGRGDIGQRMHRACARFPRGRVAIIGSDIPDARAADLLAAFRTLGRTDAVFGPAMDGGFWLVSLGPRRPARPFDRVRWSGEHALSDTLRNFRGWRTGMARRLQDVDDWEDWQRLFTRNGLPVPPA